MSDHLALSMLAGICGGLVSVVPGVLAWGYVEDRTGSLDKGVIAYFAVSLVLGGASAIFIFRPLFGL